MRFKGRLIIGVIIALMTISAWVIPVYAIDSPDVSFSIDSVFVYQHCVQENDQLYLVEYTASYTTNPTETITEAFIGRLMNGTTELGNVTPYAYYDTGYGQGIFAIYFSAADAPTWNGAYTMKFEGNPTLTWTGSIPMTSVSTFDSWSASTGTESTQNELTSRILYLADQLEQAWSVNMIESSGAGSYLSTYGEAYFTSVISNLRAMAPGVFAGSSQQPVLPTKTYTQAYSANLSSRVTGTPLDLSPVATLLGISTNWLGGLVFFIFASVVVALVCIRSGTNRPVIIMLVPMLIFGTLIGMLKLDVIIIGAFGALALIAFALFYHPSGA